jgi:hypothetical protein
LRKIQPGPIRFEINERDPGDPYWISEAATLVLQTKPTNDKRDFSLQVTDYLWRWDIDIFKVYTLR